MKKLFSFALGLFAMTTLQAANTEVARLTLTGQGGTESCNVTLRVDPSISAPVTTSFFGATDEVGQVNIYVAVGDDKYAQYKENAIANLDLQVITNRRAAEDQHYTLTFNVPTTTDGLTLKDLATGTVTDITHNGTYEFDVNTTLHPDYVEGTNYTIKNRFVVNYDAASYVVATVTTNAYGWASFSYDADLTLTLPAGLKIYTGAVNGEYLDLSEVDYVKANEGVIVKGEANTTYNFAAGTGSSEYGTNHLKPTSAFDKDNYSNVFVLKDEALYEYVGTTALAANKAYLQLPSGSNNAPKRISFRFNNTTAVESVAPEAVKAEKFMENGQVLIKRGEAIYNLQGQMVK